ncbi:MAG TPA: FAD-dependent oxidoreductase [Candidatus Angelobacter sp.]|nr:FAD-dependent oxidoreductase [Candidatus Angelobacter sp.]
MERTDVAVIGGGIIGCAAAAMLATRGAAVTLIEATEIGAGASGRNLGAIQHPFDDALTPLYRESLERYRALADGSEGAFMLPDDPAGLLLVTRDPDAAARQAERMSAAVPELDPELVNADALARLEPSLARGLSAVRLATGYPIPPAAATDAWAGLAHARGARLLVGMPATLIVGGGAVLGVRLEDGSRIAADRVLVAAGPWTPRLVDPAGTWQPIVRTWGVTLQLALGEAAPRHVVEEDEVDAVNRAAAATRRAEALAGAEDAPSLVSMASAAGRSTLGSTFLPIEPDPARIEPLLLQRAAAFLPAIADAQVTGRRLCARPQSVDGRPFIGPMPGIEGLHVCAGHGPWGISTGPASAALAARAILDGTAPPQELDAARRLALPDVQSAQ